MPSRVTSFSLTATVYAHVELPSFINLNPDEEGCGWWVKWDTLYYKEGEEVKEYQLKYLDYEGDYKHPRIEYVEEEEIKEDESEEEEEEIDEAKVALYHEELADIARGK